MMASILLLAIVALLPCSSALTEDELSQFQARIHQEPSTNLQATVNVSLVSTDYYLIESNGIPDHESGPFPGKGNPNNIEAQTHSKRFAVSPAAADSPTCLPLGPIGFSRNGVALYNPLNVDGENAVEGSTAEVFDTCNGHPDVRGVYHYHQTPDCLYVGSNDEFIGIALDGFPIYGIKDYNGNDITSADLDDCHGRMENGTYRYRLTRDWPYILGCFRGTPSPDIASHMLTGSDCKILSATEAPKSSVYLLQPSLFGLLFAICVMINVF